MIQGISAGDPIFGDSQTTGTSDLDRDAFMRLLVAQLQNQDPLSPQSNEDFIAQLAQFSSLEEMQGVNENLVGLAVLQQSNALMGQLTEASREQATTSDEIVHATAEMNELVQQVAGAMGEQAQAVEVVSQGSEQMRDQLDQVTASVREQTQMTTEVSRSMKEVNQAAESAFSASQEMNQSTGELARQAEQLKNLANSFEGGGDEELTGPNGEVVSERTGSDAQ